MQSHVLKKHDLANYASRFEQLLCVSCLGKWKSLCDDRLDLLLLKADKVEERRPLEEK